MVDGTWELTPFLEFGLICFETCTTVESIHSTGCPHPTCFNAILGLGPFWAVTVCLVKTSGTKMVRGPPIFRAHYHPPNLYPVIAAQTIANIVKSSLGPMGLDKMLVDNIGVSICHDRVQLPLHSINTTTRK